MQTEIIDLPLDLKERIIEELASSNYVLADENPIKKDALGYTCCIKSTDTNNLGTCKIVVIPEELSVRAKEDLMRVVEKEVLIRIKV